MDMEQVTTWTRLDELTGAIFVHYEYDAETLAKLDESYWREVREMHRMFRAAQAEMAEPERVAPPLPVAGFDHRPGRWQHVGD